MNCYNHPQQTAVAQCVDCNKGLCPECASNYSIPICNACNKARINNEVYNILKEMAITLIFGVTLTYFMVKWTMVEDPVNYSLSSYILFSLIFFYVFAGIVPGWKTLTSITPRVFLLLPLIGWLFYFLIKLFLAFWVGLVALPIRTIRNITRLISLIRIPV